jgi:hypothetical protein
VTRAEETHFNPDHVLTRSVLPCEPQIVKLVAALWF